MPGSWLCEVPEKRWYRGNHRVGLTAAEIGLKLDNRVASLSERRFTPLIRSRRRLSVRKVRRKNSMGSWYSATPPPK